MNNNKGFTLIEVMTSLMVLMIMTSFLLPILTTIYEERISIQQEKQAVDFLNKAISNWVYDRNSEEIDELNQLNTLYTFSYDFLENEKLKACISWEGKNKRFYERCGIGKR